MRKIALILMLITTIPTYATTMCAENDTVAIVLDPSVKPTNRYSDSEGNWGSQTPYGIIYGNVKIENGKCLYRITHPILTTWTARSNTNNTTLCAEGTSYDFFSNIDFRRAAFSLITN